MLSSPAIQQEQVAIEPGPDNRFDSAHGDRTRTKPLVDPYSVGIGEMLDVEPPARRWLLDGLLPLEVVGLLAAGGGVGKSFLIQQLGIAVATGRPFLGLEVGEPGGVLILAAEDERDELHRRLHRIVTRMQDDGDLNDGDLELLRERLFIASRVGENNRLTDEFERMIVRTGITDQIVALVDELPDVKLIVLDPVSRFRGGDENANDAATRFVEVVESLRSATGATVLLPHHVSKDGLRAGAEALSVEMLRGASALVDGVRWAAAMATLRKDAAKDYSIDPDDAGRYVRLDAVKNNYAAPWRGMWLERSRGGVLKPTELSQRKARDERKAEDRYSDILPRLQGLIRQHQEKGDPLTRRRLRDFAGKSGMFGVGDQTLRGIVERALAEGQIAEQGEGRIKELRTWK